VGKESLRKMNGNLKFVLYKNQNFSTTNLYYFTYLFLSYLALNCKLNPFDSYKNETKKDDDLAKATGVYIRKIPHNSRSEKTGSSAEMRNWYPTGKDFDCCPL
jgi:hypothetical protein